MSEPGVHLLTAAPANVGKQKYSYRVSCADTCLREIKPFLVRKIPYKGISLFLFIVQEM